MGSAELERRVVELVTATQRKEEEESPVVWAMELGQCVAAAPSIELGEVVVSQLCFRHNKPSLWKFLDLSLSSGLLSPLHVLSLLSSRFGPSSLSLSLFHSLNFFPFQFVLIHCLCFVGWFLNGGLNQKLLGFFLNFCGDMHSHLVQFPVTLPKKSESDNFVSKVQVFSVIAEFRIISIRFQVTSLWKSLHL